LNDRLEALATTKIDLMRERLNDLQEHAVREVFLFHIARDVDEWHDGDRRLAGQGGPGRCAFHSTRAAGFAGWKLNLKRIGPDRLGDILELPGAEIADHDVEPGLDLPIGLFGEADRAGLRDSLQSRGDIDAVTHNVAVALLDDVADMNADPEIDTAILRDARVALDHGVLPFDGAAHRIDYAAKLDEHPITGALEYTSIVHGDGGVYQIAS
jgi:hypothetical protein